MQPTHGKIQSFAAAAIQLFPQNFPLKILIKNLKNLIWKANVIKQYETSESFCSVIEIYI